MLCKVTRFPFLVAIGISVLASLGCSREVKTSTVSFKVDLSNSSHFSSLNQAQSGGAPSSLAEINCMFLMVGASDLNQNACVRTVDSNTINFPVGKFSPFVKVNSSGPTEVAVEVAPGSGRSIYLVGFKSNNGICPAGLSDFNPGGSNHSAPFVLGISNNVSLKSGPQDVSMSVGFNPSSYVTSCAGLDIPGGGGSGWDTPYLRVEGLFDFDLGDNPSAQSMTKGVCYKIRLATYKCPDEACPISDPFEVEGDLPITITSDSEYKFYGNSYDCVDNAVPINGDVYINDGTAYKDIYFASPGYAANQEIFDFEGLISVSADPVDNPGGVEFYQFDHSFYYLDSPVIRMSGVPTQIEEYQCSAMPINFSLYDADDLNQIFDEGSNPNVFAQSTIFELSLDGVSAYSDASCTNPEGGSSLPLNFGYSNPTPVYLRMDLMDGYLATMYSSIMGAPFTLSPGPIINIDSVGP